MSNPLRDAFLTRLQTKVYEYLKGQKLFSQWSTVELYQIAAGVVYDKKKEINEYLDQREFTISQSETAAEEILQKILISAIEKLRI